MCANRHMKVSLIILLLLWNCLNISNFQSSSKTAGELFSSHPEVWEACSPQGESKP